MSALVWKLLRKHISIGQLAGFFLANLFGMMIVLLSVQFYKDIIPIFTEGDSFMKKDYIIVSKRISTLGSFAGKSNTFSPQEIKELKEYIEEAFTDYNDINEDTRMQLELINRTLAELQAQKSLADSPRNPIGFVKPKQ